MSNVRHDIRLLLVEDNTTNQEIAIRILEHLGYQTVKVAADGNQALTALAVADFDLVLMDCHLPGIDGYETCRQIRRRDSEVRNHDIPIVATTAAAMDSDRRKCFAAGMNGYVSKPLRFAALQQAIEEWTGGMRTVCATPAPPPLQADSMPLPFDRQKFGESVMGNEVLARRVIRRFVDDMPRQIALLAQAVSEGDAPRVRLMAHSIKGAAASVSGPEMRDASWKLEQQGRDGNLTAAAELLQELSTSFERARPIMESFCREGSDELGLGV
jgi:CheY-like chemotaxis protein/HPt (histidine-containing phosphotransfer) domain-containing protein